MKTKKIKSKWNEQTAQAPGQTGGWTFIESKTMIFTTCSDCGKHSKQWFYKTSKKEGKQKTIIKCGHCFWLSENDTKQNLSQPIES